LLARCVVLESESREGFAALLQQHLERLQPADGVELGMIEEMVAAAWRLRRAWAVEARTLDNEMAAQTADDPLDRLTASFAGLAGSQPLELLQRYETRLHRCYQRALYNLMLLRTVAGRGGCEEGEGVVDGRCDSGGGRTNTAQLTIGSARPEVCRQGDPTAHPEQAGDL
jgi:hypothetical protein